MRPWSTRRRQPPDGGGDDRCAAGGGLEGDQAERLGAAGDDAHVGGPVVRGQELVRLRIDVVDAVGHPAGVGQIHQALERLLPVGTARAPDDHQVVRLAARGAELGQGLDGGIGALERLDPADEEEEPPIEREPEGPAGLRAVARPEEGVVDPEGDDADAARVGAVERGDLLGLHAARRQHGVRAVDDRRLGLGPPVGHVGLDLFGHRLGLDPIQGVEGADERQVELVLDDVAGKTGEPVVGVHRGEGAVLVVGEAEPARRGHAGQHALGELVDHGRQRLFGQGGQGAGGHVVDPEPRLHLDHRGEIGGPGPGEDVTGGARTGQGGGELAHVDVHAAAVPGAGLGQGRRVEGEDGEPTHGDQSLPVGGVSPALVARGGPDRPASGGSAQGAERRGLGRRLVPECGALVVPVPLVVPVVVPVLVLVVATEGEVDADEGLLLVLAQGLVGQDQAAQVRRPVRRLEDARPARRASPPKCAAPWRSAGGSPPTAAAAPARSGSDTDWRSRRARTAAAARGGRCPAAHG